MAKLNIMSAIVLGVMWCSISIPPVSAHSDGLCWIHIDKCMLDQLGRSLTGPKFDPTTHSFNMTQSLCCPLIVQTAQNDRECFCAMDTVVHQIPSLASNVTNLLSICNIVDSIAALDNFCIDIAPTPAEAPIIPIVESPMMSVMPPL